MTQKQAVLDYIAENGSISPMQAFYDLGITKLATVVSVLIREGHKIKKDNEQVKTRYGKTVTFKRYSFEGVNNGN